MPWSRSRPKASTAGRGYGRSHERARAAAALIHSPTDPCVRCGHALGPMGPWLHFDHNDARTGYLGFSHGRPCQVCGQRCNLKAGAQKGRRLQRRDGVASNAKQQNVPTVRVVVDRW